MKKIIITIGLLFIAIVAMAYLYFSKLHTDQNATDIGLHAATSSSGLVFSFQNDKGITDILKEQKLFEEVLGQEKYKQFTVLKKQLLSIPDINQLVDKQNIHISFVPGKNQEIDYLCFTQINSKTSAAQIFQSLKTSGIQMETSNNFTKLTMADSSVFYIGIKETLVVLSNSQQQVAVVLAKNLSNKSTKFIEYIQACKRFTKNSLGQLYINFNQMPVLLKNIIAGQLNGELAILNKQDSFAALTYNYSNDKILLTGTTIANETNSYYHLFSDLQAQKISITNILPYNTSSYTVFAIDSYLPWKKNLDQWFINRREDKKIQRLLTGINNKYHLNLGNTFPQYFKNQIVTFQLSTTEKIGAINLSNGDKLTQLLIDLSNNYSEEIKVLKEPDLLYAYFGQPFKDFKMPFYVIIDNYMVFANSPGTLNSFLNSYKSNQLLINTPNYSNANNQLPGNSSIIFYIDHLNSNDIFRRNMYPRYYKYIQSEEGLKKYDSFTYQLSGDNGKFQTNILINKQSFVLQKDSLAL